MTTTPNTPPAKKTTARKAPAKKAAAKPAEFAPVVGANGKLSHKDCGHPSTLAGRSACRAAYAKANAPKDGGTK